MDSGGLIDLDIPQNRKNGIFWKLTNLNFQKYLSGMHVDRRTILNIYCKDHIYHLQVYRHKYKPEIEIHWGDCIVYRLRNNSGSTEAELSEFSTDCDEIINGNLKIKNETKSKFLLDFIDAISLCFGIKRLSLIDDATPRSSRDIDLSLYMIMKHSQTFYERYGFTFCDKTIDYSLHKDLLRYFRFDAFMLLLNESQSRFVGTLKTKVKFTYLHEFYTHFYDILTHIHSRKRLLELQKLLQDRTKPWFSMVSILTKKKTCMEKNFSSVDLDIEKLSV